MNDEQYLQHCRQQLDEFAIDLVTRTESLEASNALRELALTLQEVTHEKGDIYTTGADLIVRLCTTYPDFVPTFPRELLWFLGGDCLHFMPDEEIALFQQFEDNRRAAASSGEVFDFQAARLRLMK
jgi:hypothetical protein